MKSSEPEDNQISEEELKEQLDILGDLTRSLADNAMGNKILTELKDNENMI